MKPKNSPVGKRPATSIAIAAFLGLPVVCAYSQIQVAEDLVVNLDAATYTNGNPWANAGSYAGSFTPQGAPTKQTGYFGAAHAVEFSGADYFEGMASTGTLHDFNANYSIEVWAFNPIIDGEETLVSWSKRGGPDGSNVSLNYGTDDRWGAMGHWGSADMGWNNGPGGGAPDPNTPTAGQWHHIVYRYNGQGHQTIYVDGIQRGFEGGLTLDPHDGVTIKIGSQTEGDGITATGGLRLSGAIGKVRIHAGTVSAGNVINNYNLEAAEFGRSQVATSLLSTGPKHRYTFNNLSSGADGTVITDVVGGAHGVVRGGSAVPFSTSGLDLPGGGSDTQAYVDLPNGIISANSSITLETWVTVQSNQGWSRIFDFGTGTAGELTGPGPLGVNGSDYIILTGNAFGTGETMRLERLGTGNFTADNGGNNRGSEMHVVVTYDDAADLWNLYRDGVLLSSNSSLGGPSTIPDVNNWLGRSNWTNDANLDGIFNEFRIYDYALSVEQIRGNMELGPDVVNVPEPGSAALLGLGAAALLRRRRKQAQ